MGKGEKGGEGRGGGLAGPGQESLLLSFCIGKGRLLLPTFSDRVGTAMMNVGNFLAWRLVDLTSPPSITKASLRGRQFFFQWEV